VLLIGSISVVFFGEPTPPPPPIIGGLPGLGGYSQYGGRRRTKKKGKKKTIRPSFTALTFDLRGMLPKGTEFFGVLPSQIRRIPINKKKTKTKKKRKKK